MRTRLLLGLLGLATLWGILASTMGRPIAEARPTTGRGGSGNGGSGSGGSTGGDSGSSGGTSQAAAPVGAGTWTQLTNFPPMGGAGTMLLLTDGTVLAQGPGVTKQWGRLVPDAQGNYVNGTWLPTASMSLERLYFGSNVLPNGKVFVLGGEYSGPGGAQNITNTGEIYDPVTNTWSPTASFPLPEFGDDPTMLLPNGKILCGYIFDGTTYLYDPATNTFSQTGTKLRNDRSDEETWVLLPDGSVLSYDVFGSPPSGPGHAQRYVPSTGSWVDAGSVPVYMTGSNVGFELGPATLLPNGRVLQIGANQFTALYSPSNNSWFPGPLLPTGMGADDAPGVMLTNGHFLFLADTTLFVQPTRIFDYNPQTNAIVDVTPPAGTPLGDELAGIPAFICRFLSLPNGHVLLSTAFNLWDYDSTADGGPQGSWRPTISSVKKSGTSFTLTGTKLTGMWQGASYGDDAEMDSNYPLIRVTDGTGKVTYLRTTNWTPGVASNTSGTVQFSLPKGFAPGTYNMNVVTNGIASANFKFTTANSIVTSTFNSGTKTLTLTGDNIDSSLTIARQGSKLTLTAGAGTVINGTNTVSYTVGTAPIAVTGDMMDGNDTVALLSMAISTIDMKLGNGNDSMLMNYCTVATSKVDGGQGTDTFVGTTSKITSNQNVGFP